MRALIAGEEEREAGDRHSRRSIGPKPSRGKKSAGARE